MKFDSEIVNKSGPSNYGGYNKILVHGDSILHINFRQTPNYERTATDELTLSAPMDSEVLSNNIDARDSAHNEISHQKSALFAVYLSKYSKNFYYMKH